MINEYNSLKSLINNLQISVNNISSSFQNIQKIYQYSNNNLNIDYKDNRIDDCYIKTIYNELIKNYINEIDDKIKNLINDNNEFNKIINEKLNNNINSDLIIKNNLYINEKLDEFTERIDDLQFNKNNGLRTDEIYKIKELIYSKDDLYKDDIKQIKLDCNLIRDKILDNWIEIINITKNLQNQINEILINYNNINDFKNEINLLKDENKNTKNDIEKLKQAMKILLDKVNKKQN